MTEHLLFGLAAILILGTLAQWLAWRLHLPSILLLLVIGIVAGPVLGALHPDEIFGDLLFPLVSLSVAVILFEGGLNLQLKELRTTGRSVLQLVTVGVVVTWILTALTARYLVDMSWSAAVLLGAVLVVSGPTVIIPLLRQIRPTGRVASILKWEGIVNDPVGAILAVLIFEVILYGQGNGAGIVIKGALRALVPGILIGVAGAGVIVLLLKRYIIPDFLQNPAALMMVVLVYTATNALQDEAGLLAVTVMGIALANQQYVSIKHITEFKETLRVLIISSLFIILSARLPVTENGLGDPASWLLVVLLVFVVRPAAVFVSTIGVELRWRERLLLAWMAPRGIVAAAVVSVFAMRLMQSGHTGYEAMVPITFQVIIGTVAVYGLTAPIVARRLKLAQPDPQGVLVAGAAPWVQQVALMLQAEGIEVALADTNWSHVSSARKQGLRAYYGDILSEDLLYGVHLDGIGRLLALTPNDEVNALAVLHFVDLFGSSEVYQLPPAQALAHHHEKELPLHLRGRYLFDDKATYTELARRFAQGEVLKKHSITETFDLEAYREKYGEAALLLFILTDDGKLEIATSDNSLSPKPGQKIISLVQEQAEATEQQRDA